MPEPTEEDIRSVRNLYHAKRSRDLAARDEAKRTRLRQDKVALLDGRCPLRCAPDRVGPCDACLTALYAERERDPAQCHGD